MPVSAGRATWRRTWPRTLQGLGLLLLLLALLLAPAMASGVGVGGGGGEDYERANDMVNIRFDPDCVLPGIKEQAEVVMDRMIDNAAHKNKENRRFLRSHLHKILNLRLHGMKKKIALKLKLLGLKAIKKKVRRGRRKIHQRGSGATKAHLAHDPRVGRQR